jgi:hypothetical protein
MQFAEQAAVKQSFGRKELAGKTAFETNAGIDARSFDRLPHTSEVSRREAKRFLQDKMLAGRGGANSLVRSLRGESTQRDDVHIGIRQQVVEVLANLN